MDREPLHSPKIRALLTAMAAEPSLAGWLAGVALSEPGELTEAEIAALGEAMARATVPVPSRPSAMAGMRPGPQDRGAILGPTGMRPSRPWRSDANG